MTDPTHDEMEKGHHLYAWLWARFQNMMLGRQPCAVMKDAPEDGPAGYYMAEALHSHAVEAVKARDDWWGRELSLNCDPTPGAVLDCILAQQEAVRREVVKARDKQWTTALFGGPGSAEEPEAAARRLQAAMENRRDARDQWWKAHEAAAVHDRDREWHTELGIAESIDYKPHGAARFLIERHEAECEWRTRFERLNVLVAEEEEAVKAATEEADEHWVRESDHWHKLYEQERQAREKAEALAESRRLIIASQHAEREQIIANAHRNVAEEREAREKAEKELAREKNVSAEWERTFRGCEQAMLRAEKELAEARATKDMYKERWQTALANLARVRDLHDHLSDEVARLRTIGVEALNRHESEAAALRKRVKELEAERSMVCYWLYPRDGEGVVAAAKRYREVEIASDNLENAALRKRVENQNQTLEMSLLSARQATDHIEKLQQRVEELEEAGRSYEEKLGSVPWDEFSEEALDARIEQARREGAEEVVRRATVALQVQARLIELGAGAMLTEMPKAYRAAAEHLRAFLPIDPPKAQEEKPKELPLGHEFDSYGSDMDQCYVEDEAGCCCGAVKADHQ